MPIRVHYNYLIDNVHKEITVYTPVTYNLHQLPNCLTPYDISRQTLYFKPNNCMPNNHNSQKTGFVCMSLYKLLWYEN